MTEIDEHDNWLFPDREERRRIARNGTDEEIRKMGFGAVWTALTKAKIRQQQKDIPRFLYPKSRQYPFDETMSRLVEELEERKFRVPGIKVEIDSYGPSKAFSLVREVAGPDFRLRFCRVQDRVTPGWNDTAAVNRLNIPKKELSIYEDFSGPTFYLYVGKNWKRDRYDFEIGSKVNSKLDKEPRTYLRYAGSDELDRKVGYGSVVGNKFVHNGPAKFLIHDNDLGREYDLKPGDPGYFQTADVFNEFNEFFKGVVEKVQKG